MPCGCEINRAHEDNIPESFSIHMDSWILIEREGRRHTWVSVLSSVCSQAFPHPAAKLGLCKLCGNSCGRLLCALGSLPKWCLRLRWKEEIHSTASRWSSHTVSFLLECSLQHQSGPGTTLKTHVLALAIFPIPSGPLTNPFHNNTWVWTQVSKSA